jgi:hypothetical protein
MKFAKKSKMQGVHEVEQYSRSSTIDSVHEPCGVESSEE